MLVLGRKRNETVWIGDDIMIKVAAVKGRTVRLAIEAPKDIVVLRGELVPVGVLPSQVEIDPPVEAPPPKKRRPKK